MQQIEVKMAKHPICCQWYIKEIEKKTFSMQCIFFRLFPNVFNVVVKLHRFACRISL